MPSNLPEGEPTVSLEELFRQGQSLALNTLIGIEDGDDTLFILCTFAAAMARNFGESSLLNVIRVLGENDGKAKAFSSFEDAMTYAVENEHKVKHLRIHQIA